MERSASEVAEACKRAANSQGDVRKWQKWRDDVKALVPKAKQTGWPTTPDNDDIPF
jgi:hypothetical protein